MSEPTKSESLQLPTELIDQILYFLEAQPDHFAASQVSKQWSKVAVPYVWRRIAPKQADTLRRLVTTVILNGNPLSPVMRFDGNFNFVKELDLENLSLFNAEPYSASEKILVHCRLLETVNFRNCLWITDHIVSLLVNCTKLKKIILTGCASLAGSTLPLLTENLLHLDHLSIAYCTGISTLVDTFTNCRAPLRILDMRRLLIVHSWNEVVQSMFSKCSKTLETLYLEWGKNGRYQLCGYWQGRLFDVIFNEGAVSEEAFSKIDEAPGPFCVKELSLNHCLITDAVLRRLHAFCPTLRSISLLGCVDLTAPALTRFLMNVRRLVKLDLSWNKNVDDEVIAHAAPCCQELQNVSLSGTAITDFGLLDLSTHCKQLRSLKLDVVPNITPHGVYKLAVDCVHLEQLSLMNCDGLLGSRIQQLSLMLHQENARESIEFRSKDEIRKIAELGQQDTW